MAGKARTLLSCTCSSVALWLLPAAILLAVNPSTQGSDDHGGHKPHSEHRGSPSHHWTYGEQVDWDVDFSACGGHAQSPINIDLSSTTFDSALQPIVLTGYNLTAKESLQLRNNGHTVVLGLPDDLSIVQGLPLQYRASQLHFHWGSPQKPGSEHTVDGEHYPGEIHMVYYSSEYSNIKEAMDKPGGLAVLGAFIEAGPDENRYYKELLQYFGKVSDEGQDTQVPGFNIAGLLPDRLDRYYRYNGSLTTPPCFQSVNWTLFNDTIKISMEQLLVLEETIHGDNHEILHLNFRDPQNLNGRHVLASFRPPVGGTRALIPDLGPSPVSPAPGSDPSDEKSESAPEEEPAPLPVTPAPDGYPTEEKSNSDPREVDGTGEDPSIEGTGGDHSEEGTGDKNPEKDTGGAQPEEGIGGSQQKDGDDGEHAEEGVGGDNPVVDVGGDHPEEGTGGDKPVVSVGGDHPEEGTGGDNPEEDVGQDHPEEATGGDDPDEHVGGDHPEEGTGGDNPEEDVGQDHPEEATGGDNPEEGADEDLPEEGTGGDKPVVGVGGDHPEEGTGGDKPVVGVGGDHPEEGTGGDNPEEDVGEDHPEEATGGDNPEEGADKDLPEEGTSGGRTEEGVSGDKQRGGTNGAPPVEDAGETPGSRNSAPDNGDTKQPLTSASLSIGAILAIVFAVLFAVTAVAFCVYVRKQQSKNRRMNSEDKPNVIYKAATMEENIA
ncbi:uncharacterized protein [Ambystoma mexicanum]|uniref:uncharacterized protein isoform X2 n=1 Tax=Ambystoma mexicanum TaxID=8296 RepID=UPI0037E76563